MTSRIDLNYLILVCYDYQFVATFIPPRQLHQHGPLDKGALSGRVARVGTDWECESIRRPERDNPSCQELINSRRARQPDRRLRQEMFPKLFSQNRLYELVSEQ
jgi:hypothetical protein